MADTVSTTPATRQTFVTPPSSISNCAHDRDSNADVTTDTAASSPAYNDTRSAKSSAIGSILNIFRKLSSGKFSCADFADRRVFDLLPQEYQKLLEVLSKESNVHRWLEDKARYDYRHLDRKFTIRMPGALHEVFFASLGKEIQRRLWVLENGQSDIAKLAKSVYSAGHTTIITTDPASKHDPDGSFKRQGPKFPALVIEVSHSQRAKDLGHLADDYILGSDFNIRRMLGFDLSYKGKGVELFTYTPAMADDTMAVEEKREILCEDTERFNPDCQGVTLPMQDFVYPSNTSADVLSASIHIPARTLFEIYQFASQEHEQEISNSGFAAPAPGKRKRPRTVTPEEELSEGREALFAEESERVSKKQNRTDRTFRCRSGSRHAAGTEVPGETVITRSMSRTASSQTIT